MSLKEEFATYSFQEKRACHATQGHLGKHQLVRRQKEPGKGTVRAHIVIPREEMGEAIGKFRTGSVQFSSVAQSCPTLCDPMNCSTPGLPVHHQLPEFTQTHVHRVSDAIQPSHPLSSPFPPAPNPSQHQSLFQ